MEINEILESLSEEQKNAVTETEGNIRLVAGAGSGKTNALTKRVAYICKRKNVAPERILSVTFTNKAAEEMRERVSNLLGVEEDKLQMMTFHRLALNICKKFLSKIGYPVKNENGEEVADIVIGKSAGSAPISAIARDFFEAKKDELSKLSEDDRKYFMSCVVRYAKSVLKGQNYTSWLLEKENVLADPAEVVSYERDREAMSKEIDKEKKKVSNLRGEIKKIYGKTDECYDYYRSMKNINREIRNMRGERSANAPTKSWAKALIKEKIKTKVLSFDDLIMFAEYLLSNFEDVREYWQNQYDYIQVDEFQDTDYKQLNILKLLTEKNQNLFVVGDPDQSIYMFRGVKPEIFNTLNEHLPNLKTIFMKDNYRSSEAVVKSANAVIKLNRNRIKKELVSKSEIKDMEAPLLCAGTDKYSAAALEYDQIMKMVKSGVDPNNICVLYRDRNCEITAALVEMLRNTDIPLDCQYQATTYADSFSDIALNLLKYKYSKSANFLGDFIDGLFGEDYTEVFDENVLDASVESWESVSKLIDMLIPKKFTKAGAPTGKYKKYVEAKADIDSVIERTVSEWYQMPEPEKALACSEERALNSEEEVKNGLHIMTIHKSKGLEFDYVFANMDFGMCPKVNNFTTLDSLEEDVRLAYVAITRAKKQIYLGFMDASSMSPFIAQSNLEIAPIHSSLFTLPGKDDHEDMVKTFLKMLDCYFLLNEEGIYELRANGEVVGYRYATMVDGSRVYFHVKVMDAVQAGVNVLDLNIDGTKEVMMDGESIKSYEENVTVYDIIDKDVIEELLVNMNPVSVLQQTTKPATAA